MMNRNSKSNDLQKFTQRGVLLQCLASS